MVNSQDIVSVEQRVWNAGNKYRGQFESGSIVTIWSEMIYLSAIRSEYAVLLEQPTLDLNMMIGQLHDLAQSNEIQAAVVSDFNESIRHALLPRTNEENRLQIFNDIREDGLTLIHEQCDRITLMKILQRMNIDYGPRMNGSSATPDRLNKLMASIALTKVRERGPITVYDPTAGTGGSLIAMRRMLGKSISVKLVGQELDPEAYLRCNMMLDLIDDDTTSHHLSNNDALSSDKGVKKLKADIILSDPPYSVNWNPEADLLKSIPYSEIGVLPPKSRADFAFVLNGLSRLKAEGTMVIQLPHGVLFRGAAEAKIRQYLIEQNYIDAVIGLPANLQYETSIPTMLLVLRRNRSRKDVLFIDASDEAERSRPRNNLPESAVNRIVATYQDFRDDNQYAHVAAQSEIISNDFNLNIPRYVDNFVPPEKVSIANLENHIASLNDEINVLDTKMRKIMAKYHAE